MRAARARSGARPPGERRGGGLRRLPDALVAILDPAARRRGLAGARLLSDWAGIVGPQLAARTQPVKLGQARDGSGGVLQLRVDGAAALELQHATPQVIERINGFFGYPAVHELRLVQAPWPRPRMAARPPDRPLPPERAAAIEAGVARVADARLRAALADLGRAVARRPAAPAGHSPP